MWRSFFLLLLFPVGEVLAYKPAVAQRHDVYSRNGAFVLDLDPQAKRLTVFAAGKRDVPLWSVDRHVRLQRPFLSNNGKVVALVAWEFVDVDSLDKGVCIEFLNDKGKFREYTFNELCPHPAYAFWASGPVGLFWRKWSMQVFAEGDTLCASTTDEYAYVFSMDDGQILQTTRVGLPWLMRWVCALSPVGGIVLLIVLWRRRRKITTPTQQAPGV
jgi:hypothetical protein